jgi:hypothetical protein
MQLIDRHMAWERPQVEALESYVEPDGWTNWRQQPWELSGVLPVPADSEEAWEDFVAWRRDGHYHSAEPLLRKEANLKIFTYPEQALPRLGVAVERAHPRKQPCRFVLGRTVSLQFIPN